ncbi:hypothetical protein H920_08269 [Fukomys damarensis]|uniref:Uncharacterized protein n=1 Tax=Fukomys damarensis TaxID=885580 RepID=A0A091DJ95_FUKDA|nr:hypothetical protein H920_08269 [Fukomys damarensis]
MEEGEQEEEEPSGLLFGDFVKNLYPSCSELTVGDPGFKSKPELFASLPHPPECLSTPPKEEAKEEKTTSVQPEGRLSHPEGCLMKSLSQRHMKEKGWIPVPQSPSANELALVVEHLHPLQPPMPRAVTLTEAWGHRVAQKVGLVRPCVDCNAQAHLSGDQTCQLKWTLTLVIVWLLSIGTSFLSVENPLLTSLGGEQSFTQPWSLRVSDHNSLSRLLSS